MVWPTLGSRTAKEQNRRYMYRYSAWSVTLYHVYQCGDCEVETELRMVYFNVVTINLFQRHHDYKDILEEHLCKYHNFN